MSEFIKNEQGQWMAVMPNIYPRILDYIDNNVNFTFSRFGDGEFNAILGKGGANCDGHTYFQDMGKQLKDIVKKKPNYLMGLQPLAVRLQYPLIKDICDPINWVNADSLHKASISGKLGLLFNSLKRRNVVLVGSFERDNLPLPCEHFVQIEINNCWIHREAYYNELYEYLEKKRNYVVLFCASMMANVLIDRLHNSLEGLHTLIDAGSVFDPYVNRITRSYHKKLDI